MDLEAEINTQEVRLREREENIARGGRATNMWQRLGLTTIQ